MRIIIDLQGAQSPGSRYRGIGRYSLNLSRSLVQQMGDNEILVALAGFFPETIEPIRAAFEGLLPPENIVVWEAPGPVHAYHPEFKQRRQIAEKVREAFLSSLQPDWVIVASLFETEAVTSIGRHTTIPTAVVLYDLIPLIYRAHYLSNPVHEQWFLEKLDHLRRADLLLSISESSGHEAVEHLGFDPSSVVPIGTDCDEHFRPIPMSTERSDQLRAVYGIERPFVMYTGGIDHRKNIEGLIRAYAALPQDLRCSHQLAVVCAIQTPERKRLELLAKEVGLSEGELILTGYVPEDNLLGLYNACTLFVFPSWHEGFGLPILEAMRCGKAVLAANTSSLPEVVGREDALFDPHDEANITALVRRALEDVDFRHSLERHSLEQSRRFSWAETAQRALAALEAATKPAASLPVSRPGRHRPRLAYVSPLPPECTGIADYSAELLPELTSWYEVDVVIDQSEVHDAYIRANCQIRTVEYFLAHSGDYDRVVYHFGNSRFHQHMFPLLGSVPGIVVLHDFFLSGIQSNRDLYGAAPHAWAQELLDSHGYGAVRERFTAAETMDIVLRYPANVTVLQGALGVIVHSEHSRALAKKWYGSEASGDWAVIPHLRLPSKLADRAAVRYNLGFATDDLIVCSFGFLGPTKLSHRIVAAWLASPLSANHKAHLVFVGEHHGGDYIQTVLRTIGKSGIAQRIRITGWVDIETFRRYLTAADIAVQLRTLSRGETSGTVLDCMNYGLATIVNAHGSLAELEAEGVWMLPDDFSDQDLINAFTSLANDPDRRRHLGAKAAEIVKTRHAPRDCARRYFEAIERTYQRAQAGLPGLMAGLAEMRVSEEELVPLVACLARDFPPEPRCHQWLVDVSALAQRDAETRIQRVVRSILSEWIANPPEGFHVEPVYAVADKPGYRYARRFTSRFLRMPEDWAQDDPVEAWPGDVFIGLDLQTQVQVAQREVYQAWRRRRVQTRFFVHDLLPIRMPQYFSSGSAEEFVRWLEVVVESDGAICVSKTTAEDFTHWVKENASTRLSKLEISCFHNGADIDNSHPTKGLPDNGSPYVSIIEPVAK